MCCTGKWTKGLVSHFRYFTWMCFGGQRNDGVASAVLAVSVCFSPSFNTVQKHAGEAASVNGCSSVCVILR